MPEPQKIGECQCPPLKLSEKDVDRIADRIMDVAAKLFAPPPPMTCEEIQSARRDPDIQDKLDAVSIELKRLGFTAMAKEVSPENVKQSAQFALEHASNIHKIAIDKRPDGTRLAWVDPEKERYYKDLLANFRAMNIIDAIWKPVFSRGRYGTIVGRTWFPPGNDQFIIDSIRKGLAAVNEDLPPHITLEEAVAIYDAYLQRHAPVG